VFVLLPRDGAPHIALMQTPDASRRRAQFKLWIFSYTILPVTSKKWVSRIMIGPATDSVMRINSRRTETIMTLFQDSF
jgi:hypothetical protein